MIRSVKTVICVLYGLFGWVPLLYLFLSALFMTGFLQPSSSNYGPVNWLTFNFGLHTEHHDFHYIPWFRLGRLRQIAPEYYNDLKQTRSFCGLALQFAFGTRAAFNNEKTRNSELLRDKASASAATSTVSEQTETAGNRLSNGLKQAADAHTQQRYTTTPRTWVNSGS